MVSNLIGIFNTAHLLTLVLVICRYLVNIVFSYKENKVICFNLVNALRNWIQNPTNKAGINVHSEFGEKADVNMQHSLV